MSGQANEFEVRMLLFLEVSLVFIVTVIQPKKLVWMINLTV